MLSKALMWLLLPSEARPISEVKRSKSNGNNKESTVKTSETGVVKIVPIPNPPGGPDHGPIKVIYGGMMRMGSLSMAHAFATLGFRTHHLLEDGWDVWNEILPAAKAAFPRPGEKSLSFTRQDWDRILGGYDAVTDLAGYFVPQLLEAYPDAKVVLGRRDFDKWWASFESEVAAGTFSESVVVKIARSFFTELSGVRAVPAMKRILTGWFRADTLAGIRENARVRYDEHYRWIRENVPPERLLEYRVGDGWDPLCEFLKADAPAKDITFPRVNEKAEHQARQTLRLSWLLPRIGWRMVRGAVLLVVFLALLLPLLRDKKTFEVLHSE